MKALVAYKKNQGLLYRLLKKGSFVGLAGTLGVAFNQQHLVTLWGEKTAAGILIACGLISAITPSFTGILADALYPEDEENVGLESDQQK